MQQNLTDGSRRDRSPRAGTPARTCGSTMYWGVARGSDQIRRSPSRSPQRVIAGDRASSSQTKTVESSLHSGDDGHTSERQPGAAPARPRQRCARANGRSPV